MATIHHYAVIVTDAFLSAAIFVFIYKYHVHKFTKLHDRCILALVCFIITLIPLQGYVLLVATDLST